jgi:hypothetical protein
VPRKTSFLLRPVLLLVVGVLAVAGAYLLLPALLERLVAAQVREGFGLEAAPEVDLRGELPPSPPGRFSGGRISMRGAEFDGVRTTSTVIDLDPFRLDLPGSVASLALRSEEPPSGTLRAELSEEEVARLAREEADVPVQSLDLEEGGVVVGSTARALGLEVPVSVRGDLSFRGEALVFEPRRLSAAGVPVPEQLADQLLAGAGFSYRPEGLPYGAEISDVQAREGRLILSGEIERIPLGGGRDAPG